MEAAVRQLCAGKVPGDTQRDLQVQTQYQGRTFKHVLVPAWLVVYTYGQRTTRSWSTAIQAPSRATVRSATSRFSSHHPAHLIFLLLVFFSQQ